jgi:hypothetical protein
MTGRKSTSHVAAPLLNLMFVALTFGFTSAHVLEIVGKLRLEARDWLTVQQNLYVAFGPIGGGCEVLAIMFTWLTVSQRPRGSKGARHSWIAAIAASVGLATWAVIVAPMNTVLRSWTPESRPSDWTRVRDRWEIGHATQTMLYAIAFVALALAQSRVSHDDERRARSGGMSGILVASPTGCLASTWSANSSARVSGCARPSAQLYVAIALSNVLVIVLPVRVRVHQLHKHRLGHVEVLIDLPAREFCLEYQAIVVMAH